MKKLFRLFSFLAIAGMVASCSSDDPESWTQLPKDAITTESGNLSLSVNGQTSQAGSATLAASSATQGVLTLNNAIPGYATVPVDVTMTEQNNGTFKIQGSTQLTTAPSRSEQARSDNAFMTLEVSGNVTTDGKAMISVTATGAAFYIGLYRNDSISLTYCNIPCMGKKATYAAVDNTPVLTLIGVIPGEYTVAIPNVYPDATGAFEGETTTPEGTSVKYAGKFNGGTGVLELNVEPTLAAALQGGIARLWNLSLDAESTIDDYYNFIPNPYPAIRMIWTPIDENELNGSDLADLVSRAASHFVVDLLSNLTLNANGTLTAKYGDVKNISLPDFNNQDNLMELVGWFSGLLQPEMNPTQTTWMESPAGLAYWYCKDDCFYFVPDIMNIVAQANKDNGSSDVTPEMIAGLLAQISQMQPSELISFANQILPTLGLEGVDLSDVDPETIRTILSWLQTGVPLKYKVDGDYLSLYVDKTMAAPFMTLIFKFLPMLQQKIDEMAATNPMMSLMWVVLGISQLSDIETIWKTNTDQFMIAINFNKNAQTASSSAAKQARKFESPEEAFKAMQLMF